MSKPYRFTLGFELIVHECIASAARIIMCMLLIAALAVIWNLLAR